MPRISLYTNPEEVERSISANLDLQFGTNASRGDSNTRILANLVSNELFLLNSETRAFIENLSYQNASGEDLNSIGFEYYGLQRRPGNKANTRAEERSFYFYARGNQTFGAINNNSDIILPKGTRISNFPNIATGQEIVYVTKRDYTLEANRSFQYCAIEAQEVGESYNVGREILVNHDFTNYADSGSGSLACRNIYPIVNGTSTESDDSLRYRIANFIASQRNLNEESLNLAGLEIPGVIQVRVIPGYYGLGTTGIVVFGPEKETHYDSLQVIKRRIRSSTGEENRIFPVEGIYVKLDLELEIVKTQNLSFEEQESIEQSLRQELQQMIRESFGTNELNLSFVEQKIRRYINNRKIKNINRNTEYNHPFKRVTLRKTDSSIENSETSEDFIGSIITVSEEERIKLNSFVVNFI